MKNLWPFPVQNIYVPHTCTAAQIEHISHARLIQAEVYIGKTTPYLFIGTYQHPDAKSANRTPKVRHKWLPIPQQYPMPCQLHTSIQQEQYLIIPSGQGQLYWRCLTADFIEFALDQGAHWYEESDQSINY